jgi:hypothetical protein
MRKVLLVTCVLVLVLVAAASTAEARHGRRHWHGYYFAAVPYSYEGGRPGNNWQLRRFGREGVPYAYGFGRPADNFQRRGQWRESVDPAVMVPPNWQLQPPDPNWKGKRFLSPDGSSWLTVYASLTAAEPIASHMQSIAFAEGEALTYLGENVIGSWLRERKATEFFTARPLSPVAAKCGITWHSNIPSSANKPWTLL